MGMAADDREERHSSKRVFQEIPKFPRVRDRSGQYQSTRSRQYDSAADARRATGAKSEALASTVSGVIKSLTATLSGFGHVRGAR